MRPTDPAPRHPPKRPDAAVKQQPPPHRRRQLPRKERRSCLIHCRNLSTRRPQSRPLLVSFSLLMTTTAARIETLHLSKLRHPPLDAYSCCPVTMTKRTTTCLRPTRHCLHHPRRRHWLRPNPLPATPARPRSAPTASAASRSTSTGPPLCPPCHLPPWMHRFLPWTCVPMCRQYTRTRSDMAIRSAGYDMF